MASSSAIAPSVEERLDQLHVELDGLRNTVQEQASKHTRLQKIGRNRWELLSLEFKELRTELVEEMQTNQKDAANLTGSLGNRLVNLEMKVEELIKGQSKAPKT